MSRRILIVEDDEASQYIYRTVLSQAGYDVEIHSDPTAAAASAMAAPPSLIVMDIGLPGMSGIELTRELRAQPATAAVPILVLTVYAFGEERKQALEAGATGFQTKPTDWKGIVAIIEDLLAAPQAQ
jgi:CheY-like chemotaxis protein